MFFIWIIWIKQFLSIPIHLNGIGWQFRTQLLTSNRAPLDEVNEKCVD